MKSHAIYVGLCLLLGVAGCKHDDMADQAKVKTNGASAFYRNGSAARPLIAGTVTRKGLVNNDDALAWTTALPEGTDFPWKPTMKDVRRGQEIFDIYCTPCHGFVGEGDGMVVQRGFARPPSYHIARLREAAPGHFYNVITQGWGAMYSFKDKIGKDDRWRVVAYVKSLQLSQHMPVAKLSAEDATAIGGQHE